MAKTTQWFVECDPIRNEALAALLNADGIADENWFRGMLDVNGKSHDVWCVPASYVTRLRTAKRVSEFYNFKFFVRDTPHSLLRPADFLEKRRTSRKLAEAMDGIELLKKIKQKRKTSTQSKTRALQSK